MVRQLARELVPCADEVWRLQRGSDPECRFFQQVAEQGHYGGAAGGTRQGIYVFAPGGRLLASVNSLEADRVLETLRAGLDRWERLPDAERRFHAPEGVEALHRWEWSLPEDGLVLESAVRDLPADGDPRSPRAERWNRDHAWFSREEALGFLPPELRPPDAAEAGDASATVARRLARFHLVDSARGQTLPFAEPEVLEAWLASRVVARGADGIELALSGRTRTRAEGPWLMGPGDWEPDEEWPRAVAMELTGRALWDPDAGRFRELELLALGEREGRTRFNGRRPDEAVGGLGIFFRIAPDTPAARVPPAFVDVYDAPWLRAPGAE